MIEYEAIVLAGGDSRRFGSDKLAHSLEGRPLLDHALDAVADARRTVVVGPQRPTQRRVTWTREVPAGGGPLAGLAAGLRFTTTDYVVVLAGDMPRASQAVHALLQAAGAAPEVVVMTDDDGRIQPLTALWQRARLERRVNEIGEVQGAAMMTLYDGLHPTTIRAVTGALVDVDTPDDLTTE